MVFYDTANLVPQGIVSHNLFRVFQYDRDKKGGCKQKGNNQDEMPAGIRQISESSRPDIIMYEKHIHGMLPKKSEYAS